MRRGKPFSPRVALGHSVYRGNGKRSMTVMLATSSLAVLKYDFVLAHSTPRRAAVSA